MSLKYCMVLGHDYPSPIWHCEKLSSHVILLIDPFENQIFSSKHIRMTWQICVKALGHVHHPATNADVFLKAASVRFNINTWIPYHKFHWKNYIWKYRLKNFRQVCQFVASKIVIVNDLLQWRYMKVMASQITDNSPFVQRFVNAIHKICIKSIPSRIHRWLVYFPHEVPVIQTSFPCHDVIMVGNDPSVLIHFTWISKHTTYIPVK